MAKFKYGKIINSLHSLKEDIKDIESETESGEQQFGNFHGNKLVHYHLPHN